MSPRLIAGMLALAASATSVFAVVTVPITGNNQGVTFAQLSFDYSVTNPNNNKPTSTARVNLDLGAFNNALGQNFAAAYLNVVDDTGNWVVQNMPVSNGGLTGNATSLTLGNVNAAVNSFDARIAVSDEPLRVAPNPAKKTFTVGQTTQNAQGNFQAPAAPANGLDPKPAAPAAGLVTFVAGGKNDVKKSGLFPNVQAADNQCGPAAVANALTYMSLKGLKGEYTNVAGRGALRGTVQLVNDPATGNTVSDIPPLRNTPVYIPPDPRAPLPPPFPPPAINLPTHVADTSYTQALFNTGLVTPPGATYVSNELAGNSVVGRLDLFARRVSDNRPRFYYRVDEYDNSPIVDGNQGTSPQQQLNALMKYVSLDADASKQAVVTYQYSSTFGQLLTDPNVAGVNAPIDKSDVDGGGKSSVTFSFILDALQRGDAIVLGRTGHATNVVAAGYTLDQPWVVMQSDLLQTPDDPNDALIGFGNGLEFSYLSLDDNKDFKLLNVSGTPIVQDVIVISIPEPTALSLAVIPAVFMRRRSRR